MSAHRHSCATCGLDLGLCGPGSHWVRDDDGDSTRGFCTLDEVTCADCEYAALLERVAAREQYS